MLFTDNGFLNITRAFAWDEIISGRFLNYIRDLSGNARILEVGCGNGFFTRKLKNRFPESEVIGVDLNENLIEEAIRQNRDGTQNPVFVAGDACRLPYVDNSFDLVVTHFLLVDCKNAELILREMKRVVRDNGCICCFEPIYQVDFLNMFLPFLKSEELNTLSRVYRKMLIDVPAQFGIDRTISTALPYLFRKLELDDFQIDIFSTYRLSAGYSVELQDMIREQCREVLLNPKLYHESIVNSQLGKVMDPDEIEAYIKIELSLAKRIYSGESNICDACLFSVGNVIGIKAIKRNCKGGVADDPK